MNHLPEVLTLTSIDNTRGCLTILKVGKLSVFVWQKYLTGKELLLFDNWKKPERLIRHHKSKNHLRAMEMWMFSRANKRRQSSLLCKLYESHKNSTKENRQYLKAIMECLMYTATQNIAQCGHENNKLH